MDKEPNVVYYMYNPILCICVSNELLMRVGNAISLLKQRNEGIIGELNVMGANIVGGMEVDVIESCFMDVDFFDRTTLKHITDYGYSELLSDTKVT